MTDWHALTWPVASLPEAMGIIAGRLAHPASTLAATVTDDPLAGLNQMLNRVGEIAVAHGLEGQAVEVQVREISRFLRTAGPAIVWLQERQRFVVLMGMRRSRVLVRRPDHSIGTIEVALLRDEISGPVERSISSASGKLIRAVVGKEAVAKRVETSLTALLAANESVFCGWLLRSASSISPSHQRKLLGLFALFLGAYTFQYLLWIVSWFVIGRGALHGYLDHGWLVAWALALLSVIPIMMLVSWAQGLLAIRAATLLKWRLMRGALNLDIDAARRTGSGEALGRVLESDVIESLMVNGGFIGVTAMVDLLAAAVLIGSGAGGAVHLGVLLLFVLGASVVAWLTCEQYGGWTLRRNALTSDIVEKMAGHRTRLAQEHGERGPAEEDWGLVGYRALSQRLDRFMVCLQLLPAAWYVVGLTALAPAIANGGSAIGELAVSLGGVVIAGQALGGLATSALQLIAVRTAWGQVKPLWHAGAHAQVSVPRATTLERPDSSTILEADDLVFRHRYGISTPLQGCNLRVQTGDWVLLSGKSGSGKSTLISVLSGLRKQQHGLVLSGGLDVEALGIDAWRRRIVACPQFNENFIFAESLAFNLLMGRGWPPAASDLELAETICKELGLGDVLGRMPNRLSQYLGESGWQLSHGERSRVFVARALLANSDLVVLDESLESLDADSVQNVLSTLRKRAPTLMLVRHG
jgi:ATP-binding cassette subfamily B protein